MHFDSMCITLSECADNITRVVVTKSRLEILQAARSRAQRPAIEARHNAVVQSSVAGMQFDRCKLVAHHSSGP